MGFLSITFLVALPLALAPILLHLFDRRRNVTIEWGAMEFLLQAATRRTSARKLKQWILLALRVLAIAALVLALARPKLPGHWFGNSDRGETVFVIDNSMSTLRESDDTTLFAKLIERATEELNGIAPGDSVRVLLASPYPVWAMAGDVRVGSGSRELVVEQFQEIQPTNGSSDLLAAMFTAVQADADQNTQKRRIVLLTDGQATDWKTSDTSGWQRFQEVLKSASIPTQFDVIELDAKTPKSTNIAVNSVR
ncbi:MAG: BatA domain-containing protein, partial [Fuerstia sp.]|nr:BatA domain-containing protein [Fuerstiella sp.]